jgi:hypothetical protein
LGEGEGLTSFGVNLQFTDDNLPYKYPSRTLSITTPSGSFETPTRAATYYEYRSRIRITAKTVVDSPVALSVRKMNFGQLDSFINKNQPFEPLLRRVELYHHIAQYARLRLALIQPTTTSDPKGTMPPATTVLQNDASMRDRFLRFVVRLQQEAGLNPISIPFLELPFSTLESIVRDLHKSITSLGLEPVFFVDLRYHGKEFENLISLLTDELGSQLIGLIYRRFSQAPVNYDFLSRAYSERDVAFLCAQVDRYDMKFDDLSTSHYLPFFGADMYAVAAPEGFYDEENVQEASQQMSGSQLGNPVETARVGRIRFFDRQSLKVKPIDSAFFDSENVLGDMNPEDREYLSQMLENREEGNSDQKKYRALNSLSKFHELQSSSREFQDLRKYIGEGSARVYVQGKTSLEPALADIKK